jgi:hypothetical protein
LPLDGPKSNPQNDGFLMLSPDASIGTPGSKKRPMRSGIFYWLALGAGICLTVSARAVPEPTFVAYSGKAAGAAGDFLYSEHHVLKYEAGRLRERVVLYRCGDGTPFARKTASYVEPLAPDFLFEDSSNGVREGVRNEGGSRTAFFRAAPDGPEKTAPLKAGPVWVIDAGFDEYIRENWHSLLAGRAQRLHFLVPSRLSGLDFELQHLVNPGPETATENFRLQIAGVLKWLGPSIEVSYSADDRVLVRYKGLSDLRDRTGENLHTTITFRPEDRRSVDAAAFAASMQAAIAPCPG